MTFGPTYFRSISSSAVAVYFRELAKIQNRSRKFKFTDGTGIEKLNAQVFNTMEFNKSCFKRKRRL